MILLGSLLRPIDLFSAPICFVVLMMIFSAMVRKYKDEEEKRLYLRAFYYKMFFTLAYTIVISYYYTGGDTELYYDCTVDLHKAVTESTDNISTIYTSKMITVKSPLMNYFIFDGSYYPTFEAMHSPGNYFVPKLGLPVMMIFGRSYLCLAMVFSFFSLGGAIRLYKFFIHYFPDYKREMALATIFLPSLAFWSSGYLKDPITFGSVGYLVYALLNIFIKKKKIAISVVWAAVAITLLFFIKVYILLALAPSAVLWLFGTFNKLVENKTLRRIMALLTFIAGVATAFLLVNYLTSDENLNAFKLDTLIETSQYNRNLYEGFGEQYEGSYFTIKTTNPFLLVLNGIVATLFRPFLWEINSPTALLSSLEALLFLYFTAYFMYKRGVITFFRKAFSDPVLLMCIVFTLIFAAAIGSSATNFGSLSRYKIPCLPFYLAMVMILYRNEGFTFPNWFRRVIGYKIPSRRIQKTAF